MLAACGELRWHKPGGDASDLAHDLTNCRALAHEKAARAGNIGLPPAASDPRFGAPSGPTQAEQRLQEQQAVDTCMRDKGYALVPADK
jgi:hypothetical protein